MENILIPLFVCVILPICIVWLITRARKHEMDRKAEIMLKAIESGAQIDPEMFQSKKPVKGGLKQDLLDKLTGACITTFMGVAFLVVSIVDNFTSGWFKGMWFMKTAPLVGGIMLAVGIGLFVSYFAGKKMLAKEIEAEEKELEK